MKTAIILSAGIKQIMFTPETENEKEALKMVGANDNVNVVVRTGQFNDSDIIARYHIYECRGGYLRAEKDYDSVMFILTPKTNEPNPFEVKYNKLKSAIRWALGYEDFPKRKQGEGAYYWRDELQERSGLTNEELSI